MRIISSYGQANLKGTIANFAQPHNMEYDIVLEGLNLETGKWINLEKRIGPMTGYIKMKGKGISINNTNATTEINMRSVMVNGYPYSNVGLFGGINRNGFYINGTINDTALTTAINIEGEISQPYPLINGFVVVDKANLQAMHITNDSMTISGRIRFDSINTNPNLLSGTIHADSTRLFVNGRHLAADSIFLHVNSSINGSDVIVRTPFLEGMLRSGSSLPVAQNNLFDYINRFTKKSDDTLFVPTNDNWIKIDASLRQHEVFSAFIPGLEYFTPITISGAYYGNKPDSILHL